MSEEPIFFKDGMAFRKWLTKNHKKKTEQWVGYYKKATKLPSMTWSESVDQALCFGWIDGIRKSIDIKSYKIRFTPRRSNSNWSAINVSKMGELIGQGLMTDAGLQVFDEKRAAKTATYAYEQKKAKLPPDYLSQLKANKKAYAFFKKLPPSTKQPSVWWIISAKRKTTQLRRLQQLIDCCEQGVRIPQLRIRKGK